MVTLPHTARLNLRRRRLCRACRACPGHRACRERTLPRGAGHVLQRSQAAPQDQPRAGAEDGEQPGAARRLDQDEPVERGGDFLHRDGDGDDVAGGAGERSDVENLLMVPYFADAVAKAQDAWRRVVVTATQQGVAIPAFASSLSYYDGYRRERGPAGRSLSTGAAVTSPSPSRATEAAVDRRLHRRRLPWPRTAWRTQYAHF